MSFQLSALAEKLLTEVRIGRFAILAMTVLQFMIKPELNFPIVFISVIQLSPIALNLTRSVVRTSTCSER